MSYRFYGLAVAIALSSWIGAVASAQSSVVAAFSLPQQSLGDSLRAIGKQSSVNMLFDPSKVEALKAPAIEVNGTFGDALAQLLKGSGLTYKFLNEHTVVLSDGLSLSQAAAKSNANAETATAPVAERSSWAMAQAESAQPVQPNDGESSLNTDLTGTKGIQEIVVTAQKREQRLQDIPLSVTALDEQLLLKIGAIDLVDYATRIPNLAFGATGAAALSAYTFQIRGVAGVGTTGFYIDDVPITEGMNPRVMDISRIEVLRGPQGTLYGARSMGGTVRLITERADPTATEFETHATLAHVSEGDLDYAVDSAFNVPISPNLAFRGSAFYQSQTGVHDIVVDNPNVAGDEITHENADEGEYWGLQARATWTPTENLTIDPRFIYQNSHLDWVPFSDLSPGNFTARRVIDRADPNDEEWSISSLTVSWDTDWGNFTSATAFFNQETNTREEFSEFMNYLSGAVGGDPTYYPPGGSLFVANRESRQITEEARFTSEFDGPLQLTAGVFYSNNEIDTLAPCSFAEGFSAATGIPFGTDCIFYGEFRDEIEEAAVFGEFEYAILDNLFLTVGGRYFENTVSNSILQSGIVVDFGAPSRPRSSGEQSETGFNPKIALRWDVASDWTLYGSATQGYRIGGANFVPADLCAADVAALGFAAAPDTYDSDSLWSYEVGSKSTFADRRFSLNAAAYLIDWSEIQQAIGLGCGFFFAVNAGQAEARGAEVEIAGQVENLRYALGVGYTDAEITNPGGVPAVPRGSPIRQVPEWTFNGNVDYQFNLGARDGYAFLGYSWVDSSITRFGSNPNVRDSYGLLDARLGMTFGNWDLSLFGKNLTDEHANLSNNGSMAAPTPGRPRFNINRPRTIGVDFRWVF